MRWRKISVGIRHKHKKGFGVAFSEPYGLKLLQKF